MFIVLFPITSLTARAPRLWDSGIACTMGRHAGGGIKYIVSAEVLEDKVRRQRPECGAYVTVPR